MNPSIFHHVRGPVWSEPGEPGSGGGDPGSGTPPPAAGEPGAATPPAPPANWLDAFEGEARGYVENKGWKDAAEMLTGYQNLEKLRGLPDDRILALPEDRAAEGAMDTVYDALGRPEAAEGYENILGAEFNDAAYKNISAKAFELGLSDDQFKGMQGVVQEVTQQALAQEEQSAAEELAAWKTGFPDQFQNAAKTLQAAGLTEEQLGDVLAGNPTGVYEMLANLGAKMTGEATMFKDDTPPGGMRMSAVAAKSKISEMFGDETFMKRYTHDDFKIREAAMKEMNELHRIAASGDS